MNTFINVILHVALFGAVCFLVFVLLGIFGAWD